MGIAKTEAFSVRDNKVAQYAKALSHPARIAIMRYLLRSNACVCGDIVDQLPLSQSTVSQHLRELKNAGLIKGEIEGVTTCYCVDMKEWEKARNILTQFLEIPVSDNTCC
ncbi:MAG: metalloregulator ArsR/SmtB family transcription factor [Chitinophagales bacterium]